MSNHLPEATSKPQLPRCAVPVVVAFSPAGCGPCRDRAPIVGEMSRRWGHRVRFAKINVADARRIADPYQVSSIPAVVLFDRGLPVARSIGGKPAATLGQELGLGKVARR